MDKGVTAPAVITLPRVKKPGHRRGNLFKKGQSGNPAGKPKGAKNKTTLALKEMILGALDAAGGLNYLVAQAEKNPGAFMSLIAKVLPTTLQGPAADGSHTVTFRVEGIPPPAARNRDDADRPAS